MNKFMKVLMVTAVSVGMLSGCGSDEQEENLKVKMNPVEQQLFNKFTSVMGVYRIEAAMNLVSKRAVPPQNNNVPFCDVVEPLTLADSQSSVNKGYQKYLITNQWKKYKGETLRESCEKVSNTANQNSLTLTQVEVNSQIVADTVTLKDETLLSPKKIRELTDSVGTCNSAKVKLIMLTDTRKPLTISDYEVVTELIVGCEMDLLREELNK